MEGYQMLHRMKACTWLLGIALLSMVGCSEQESTNPPNFPHLREAPDSYMEALLVGELVSENGCLRVRSVGGTDYLLIWPYDSEMTADGRGARARISDGSEVTLSAGEDVRVGGGESSLSFVQRRVTQPIPSSCLGGSYWLVGEISAPTPTPVPVPTATPAPIPTVTSVPTPSPTEMSNPYLPMQSEDVNIYLEAEMVGELVLENGCLRAKGGADGDALLIWPYGSEMTTDGQGVRARKIGSDLDVTLSVGHRVRFGGGYRSINFVRGYVVEPIPSSCLGGPYWVVGEVSAIAE